MKRVALTIVIAFTAITAACSAKYESSTYASGNKTYEGWIRNANVRGNGTMADPFMTDIAFEEKGNITPFPLHIEGSHPELWQGEYVKMVLTDCNSESDCELETLTRLGPD